MKSGDLDNTAIAWSMWRRKGQVRIKRCRPEIRTNLGPPHGGEAVDTGRGNNF